jgi:hypothetical protein
MECSWNGRAGDKIEWMEGQWKERKCLKNEETDGMNDINE